MKADPGTYVLILQSDISTRVKIGRRGSLNVVPGYYLYIGSAFGPGGVRARVSRHFRAEKSMHWHIDYLREVLTPVGAWCSYDPERLEHRWAHALSGMRGMSPVPGFGCTDCRCASHLFHGARAPDIKLFSRVAGGVVSAVSCPVIR